MGGCEMLAENFLMAEDEFSSTRNLQRGHYAGLAVGKGIIASACRQT